MHGDSIDFCCLTAPVLVDDASNNGQHKLNTALFAQVEILEAENTKLKEDMLPPKEVDCMHLFSRFMYLLPNIHQLMTSLVVVNLYYELC